MSESELPTEPRNYDAIIYTPLDPPKADEPEIFSSDTSGLRQAAEERMNGAERNEVKVRQMEDPEKPGHVAPGDRSHSIDHAANSLKAIRESEALEVDRIVPTDGDTPISPREAAEQLAQNRAEQPQEIGSPAADLPTSMHDDVQLEVQPEATPDDTELDRILAPFDPATKETLIKSIGAHIANAEAQAVTAREQAEAQAEQSRQVFAQGLKNAELTAFATLFEAHPELRGYSAEELPIAIRVKAQKDPSVMTLVNRAQQVHGMARQMEQAQQLSAAARLAQSSQFENAKFEKMAANEPIETKRAVQEHGYRVLQQYYGLSREQAAQQFPVHTAIQQKALFDLVKGHLRDEGTKEALRTKAHRPIAQVQRPGISEPRGARDDTGILNLSNKLDRTGSVRDATALVIARRAASGRK